MTAQSMAKSFAATAAPAATALQGIIQNVVPKIKQIIEGCSEKTTGIMQPSVDKIVKLCLDSGLAVRRNILPRNAGIHPENRSQAGVDPINAHNLLLKISKQGYSESKLEDPMGFEKAEHGDAHDKQEKFNDNNFAEAGGYIKPISFRDVEYLPVTCSHTVAAANIIEGEGPGLREELCDEKGNIDKSKVLQLCPSWQEALSQGIPCVVFKRELEVACSELHFCFLRVHIVGLVPCPTKKRWQLRTCYLQFAFEDYAWDSL